MVASQSDFVGPVSNGQGINTCLTPAIHHRLNTTPSPPDDADPPPFIPSPDDHVSLNQYESGSNYYDRRAKASNRPGPRFYRRSTSLLVFEPLLSLGFTETRGKPTGLTRRQNTKVDERQRRRSISAPGRKSARLPPKPHWPSPVDRSNRGSHSEDKEENQDQNLVRQPSPERFKGLGMVSPSRAETDLGIFVPLEIRLRRASEEPGEKTARQASLQGPRPMSKSQTNEHGANRMSLLKGQPVETALTEAYVHTYLPDDPHEERRAATSKDRRRVSATFQTVQSRDSVYEIIWEDVFTMSDGESTESSSSSSSTSTGIELPLSLSYRSQARNGHLLTGLASWSWEGELEPYAESTKTLVPDRTAKPRRSSFKQEIPSLTGASPLEYKAPNKPTFEFTEAPVQEAVDDPETANSPGSKPRRYSTPSQIPVSQNSSVKRRRLSIQQRRELLGDRRLSNLPPDETHFGSHRDSLILARERVLHNGHEGCTRATGHREVLKRANWYRAGTTAIPEVDRGSASLRKMTVESKALAAVKTTSKSLESH